MFRATLGFAVLLGAVVGAEEPPVKDSPIQVECHGKLRTEVVAVGGETTGMTVDFDGVTIDLKVDREADRKFAEGHHKQHVTILGRLRQIKGPERGIRWVIDVDKIAPPSPEQKKGAVVTLVGRLVKKEAANKTTAIVVESGDASWPLDLSVEKSLLQKAEDLVGKTVNLVGRAVKLDCEQTTIRPALRVEKLEPVVEKVEKTAKK